MILREITIGRDRNSDIYLDARCMYASKHHAVIYLDGNKLMYKDTSSNGTLINNVSVRHRAVPIRRGDIIMLAGKYQLNWNQIDALVRRGENYEPPVIVPKNATVGMVDNVLVQQPVMVDTSKWNWGAFGLYPIWGFFNGCWWAFFVSLFFWWTFPIPNIIFGVYGSRWAWENRHWGSPQDFQQMQSSWGIWGIIVTVLNVLAWFWWIFVYLAIIMI